MVIHAMYIEDTPAHVTDFLREVKSVPGLVIEKVCASYVEAASWLSTRQHIDIIFCDIELPGPNGLQIAKSLRHRCHFFIFVSGHASHRDAAWGVGAKGYLMKPVMQDELREVVDDLRKIKQAGGVWQDESPCFFYKNVNTGALTKVYLHEVTEITKGAENKNHTQICSGKETVVVNKSLSGVLDDAAAYGLFIRVRSDAAVALSQIETIKDNTVYLQTNTRYVITDGYLDGVRQWLNAKRR